MQATSGEAQEENQDHADDPDQPAVTKYTPTRMPNVTATKDYEFPRLIVSSSHSSLFRWHHRQTHCRIREEFVAFLHRTKVIGLSLVRRLRGVLRIDLG